MERKRRSRLHPFVCIICSILILVGGLLFAKTNGWVFLCFVLFLCFCYGMILKSLKALPIFMIGSGIYFGIAYAVSKDFAPALQGITRVMALYVCIIPCLYMHPEDLLRALNQAHFPRLASLGCLLTFRFVPMLKIERKRIKEAMKTRSMGKSLNSFYRANIVPFGLRLVHISDEVALSIESKGFASSYKDVSIYSKVKFYWYDALFLVLVIASFVLSIFFLKEIPL